MVTTLDTPQLISKGLETVEQMMITQVADYHPDLKAATELILSAGGKRIRPRIILLICNMLGAERDQALKLATAIELLHNATLVHDDLIDGALLRRGIPTLNSKWSPAATVLTGDFLFASASDMASKTQSVEVMRLISRSLMTIVNGEVNQLFANRCLIDIQDYYRLIYAKTASLFETSTEASGVISNVNHQQVEYLRIFGYELGMAFQIVDDILDYVGSQSVVGKPVGGDLRQGLVTLPMLYFMESHADHPLVRRMIDGKCIREDEEIEQLLAEIRTSGAIDQAHREAAKFAGRAESAILHFPDSYERDSLIEMSRYIVDRTK